MPDVLKISNEHEKVDDTIEVEISQKFDELLKGQANPLTDKENNLKPDNMVDITLSLDEAKQLLDNEALNEAESKKAQTLVDVVKGMKTEYLIALLHKELQSGGTYMSFSEMKAKKIRSFLTQAICEREGYSLSIHGVDTLAGTETHAAIKKIQQEKLGLNEDATDARLKADGLAGPGFWYLYEAYLEGNFENAKKILSNKGITEKDQDKEAINSRNKDIESDIDEVIEPSEFNIHSIENYNSYNITYKGKEMSVGKALSLVLNTTGSDQYEEDEIYAIIGDKKAAEDPNVYAYLIRKSMKGWGTYDKALDILMKNAHKSKILDKVYNAFGKPEKGSGDLNQRLSDDLSIKKREEYYLMMFNYSNLLEKLPDSGFTFARTREAYEEATRK